MNRVANACLVILLALCANASCSAQTTPRTNPTTCPVSYSKLSMPIRHQGGMSTPMAELSFTNETKKKIDRAKFELIIIEPDNSQTSYGKALTFTAGADPGKVVDAEWALQMDKVSMEHLGESVYLSSIEFEDGTTWKDDGNQRCRDDINYGPK
jgi:hypothetical protein